MIAIVLHPSGRKMTMDAQGLARYLIMVNVTRIDYNHVTRTVTLFTPQHPWDQLMAPDEKLGWIRDFLGITMGGCCG